MTQLADAPWIREAEMFGPPEGDDIYCPVCGEENPEKFFTVNGEVLGCDCCVQTEDAFSWCDKRNLYFKPHK